MFGVDSHIFEALRGYFGGVIRYFHHFNGFLGGIFMIFFLKGISIILDLKMFGSSFLDSRLF